METLNPYVAFASLSRNGQTMRISTAAPKRGDFLSLSTFRGFASELHSVLNNCRRVGELPATSKASLTASRLAITSADVFQRPIYRARIDLGQEVASTETSMCGLQPNPDFEITGDGSLPSELKCRLIDSHLSVRSALPFGTEALLWVKDRRTDVWWPYEPGRQLLQLVRRFQEGDSHQNLRPRDVQLLAELGLLINPAEVQQLGAMRIEGGTGLITGIVPMHQATPLGNYFSELLSSGVMRLGDRDSSHRAWTHNEMLARFLGIQLSEFVSRIVNEPLSAYFSHFVSYLDGASLPVHCDREPDAVSVSIQLGYYSGARSVENQWPFAVKPWGADDFISYMPSFGDGVIFWGESQQHCRPVIPQNCRSDVLLLHFIRSGSLDRFKVHNLG